MWKDKVLEKLDLMDLKACLEEKVQEGLQDWRSSTRPSDLEDRLWVLSLWESAEQPSKLLKQVASLEPSKEACFETITELFKILPDRLVEEYYPIIRQVAASCHHSEKGEQAFQDLLSVGQEALFAAARKYFLQPKSSFKSFAWDYIREQIKKEQQASHPLPAKIRKKLRKLEKIREELRYRGQEASFELLMEELELGADQLEELLKAESLWGYGSEFETDVILEELEEEDQSPSALSLLIASEQRSNLEIALEQISDRSRTIIVGMYYSEKSLRELSEQLGVSLNSMKKAHKQALLQLKEALNDIHGQSSDELY